MIVNSFHLRILGQQTYASALAQMQAYTDNRSDDSVDEIWLLQHPPVFTLGKGGKPEHVLAPGDIPVIPTDRGGQVTYHGPGQWVAYILLDLRRLRLGVRPLVNRLEQAVIDLLVEERIVAVARPDAPGVYVNDCKIASLGLRVRRGCTYHGLSLNVDMDLEPFSRINPCGYEGLCVTQLRDLGVNYDLDLIRDRLVFHLSRQLGYTSHSVSYEFDQP